MINEELVFENTRIMFRNFSGEEGRYNRQGDRNFCVPIEDEDLAAKLIEDGWNVRILRPRDENDSPLHYIQVSVSYKTGAPRVFLVNGTSKTPLDDSTISILDDVEIESCDIIIRPYNWKIESRGNIDSGVKAYLKTMYVVVKPDPFSSKYDDMSVPFN